MHQSYLGAVFRPAEGGAPGRDGCIYRLLFCNYQQIIKNCKKVLALWITAMIFWRTK
jgi:hypothetical protein